MSRARRKGTDAERAIVQWLQDHGWPHAERRQVRGANDAGDITGTPALAWEVRNRRELRLVEWLKTTARRRTIARADIGLLIVKPDGMGEVSVASWPVVLTLADAVELLHAAGYGEAR